MRPFIRILLGLCLLVPIVAHHGGASAAVTAIEQPSTISFWGINAYLTKNERVGHDDIDLLATKAYDAGVRWTREEFPWAYIDDNPDRRGRYRTEYDGRIREAASHGLGIVGMLLTTPEWAYDPSCAQRDYWCPPSASHVDDYANFASWMVERYDGDGMNDAVGSPRVAYWEIWNEPNDTAVWHDIGTPGVTRKRRYGELLIAAYTAIKNADPTAKVLLGGMYIFDGGYSNGVLDDGLFFLNAANGVFQQVPAARNAYDIFSLHPYLPTTRPEAPEAHQSITLEGRIRHTRNWLRNPRDGNRPDDPPIWVTEVGWCTAKSDACGPQEGVTEAVQANYLIRAMVIAQQLGVEHVNWFQLEDAFNNARSAFNSMAILKNLTDGDYAPKRSYTAYSTLAHLLDGAMPSPAAGPVHSHVYVAGADRGNANDIYDYRYVRDTTTIDVVWRVTGSSTVAFPVDSSKRIAQINLSGAETTLKPLPNGTVMLDVDETPLFILQSNVASIKASSSALVFLAGDGQQFARKVLSINSGSGIDLEWRVAARDPWITFSQSTGMTPGILTVTANTNGRPAGVYSSSLTLDSTGVPDTVVKVQLVIAETVYAVYLPQARR